MTTYTTGLPKDAEKAAGTAAMAAACWLKHRQR